MFERPILIYSDYCNYSKLFITHLSKFPELYNAFIRINIDVDKNTRQRPKVFYEIQEILRHKITEVPTIIVQNGEFVLSGKEAFNWLEYQLNELNRQLEESNEESFEKSLEESPELLEAFNPLEMGSFSDGYAGIDDSVPKSQSFQFLNQPIQMIKTPEETNENFDKTQGNYSDYLQRRNTSNNNPQYQSSNERPIYKMSNDNQKINKKQNEVDHKYEQLLAEREMMFQKKQPKKVNFAEGTFK